MIEFVRQLFRRHGPLMAMIDSGLAGLTDPEYFWEPVGDCWSVRPIADLRTELPAWMPPGDWAVDIKYPDPNPSPFTTIAWRLHHMTGSLNVATATIGGVRRDDGAIDDTASGWDVAPTAERAVHAWAQATTALRQGLEGATDADLARHERQSWDPPEHSAPVTEHVMTLGYFEPASHSAEIRLLRDLYRHTSGGTTAINPA